MFSKLEKQLYINDCKLDDLEQYGRRNCLILHGCENIPSNQASYPVFENFVINKLNSSLKLDQTLSPTEIDTCHVLPSRKRNTKPIIIKFVRRSVRDAVFHNKKNLKTMKEKSERLSITESLTRRRFALLTEAKKAFGFRNVWTQNGNVVCIYKEKRQVIFDYNDIARILG